MSIKNTKSTWKAQVRLQMKITTNGLVIKEQTTGESDRLVTLLTADYGILRAFVRRAKLVKAVLQAQLRFFICKVYIV